MTKDEAWEMIDSALDHSYSEKDVMKIKEALAQPEQEPTANKITVDLLERLEVTLTNLGYATPEGGLEAFNAGLATQLYNLCQAVDGLLEKALAQPAQKPFTYYDPVRDAIRPFKSDGDISLYTTPPAQPAQEYKRGYADAMNWKVQNHLEHLPPKAPVPCKHEVVYEDYLTASFAFCKNCNKEWTEEMQKSAQPAQEVVPPYTISLQKQKWAPLTDAERRSYQKGHDAGVAHHKQAIEHRKRPWVGLTNEQRRECTQSPFTVENYLAIEAKLEKLNT
jgi:hypothetical protein